MDDPELTELALHEYKSATNMTDQFAALAAIAQNAGQVRDDVLSDFYTKWQHDFLVRILLVESRWQPCSFVNDPCLFHDFGCG